MIFILPLKLFLFWRYRFLSWIFDHVEKRFDSKEKVNFNFYDVTTWLTNNFVFIVRQVEDCWNILTLSWKPLAFTSNKVFLNNKVGYGTSLPALFLTWFLKKKIYRVMFYCLTKLSLSGCLYLLCEILSNLCIVIIC